jgi:hypothetical protein
MGVGLFFNSKWDGSAFTVSLAPGQEADARPPLKPGEKYPDDI